MRSDTMTQRVDLLRTSPFFEPLAPAYLEKLVRASTVRHFSRNEVMIRENAQADWLYLIRDGEVRLSFEHPGSGATRQPEPGDDIELLGIVEPGRVLGWSAMVRPYLYRASAQARTDVEVLAFERATLQQMCRADPAFGMALMSRIIWVLGNRVRATRIRIVACRYDREVLAIRALLDQNAEALSVTSPLYKLPAYLENRLTLADAFDVLEMLRAHGTEVERTLAELSLEILGRVRKEFFAFQSLQSIYEHIANSPDDVPEEEVRRRCCMEFIRMFEQTDHVIAGMENLPAKPGHIFVMNHLRNHPDNMLPNDFQLTLDTHFVSSMICFSKYGEAPVRVIRRAYRSEYGHKKYYARLGYIYVYSGHVDEEAGDPAITREDRRKFFLSEAAGHLRAGRNIIICPEGQVGPTETSPLPFRAGAFRLAAYVEPECLIVPVAVANFDRKLTHTRVAAVIHQPFQLSDYVSRAASDADLFDFIKKFNEAFRTYVKEAAALARRPE